MQLVTLLPHKRVSPLIDPEFFKEANENDLRFRLPDMPELDTHLCNAEMSANEMTELFKLALKTMAEAGGRKDALAQPSYKPSKFYDEPGYAEFCELRGITLIIAISDAQII